MNTPPTRPPARTPPRFVPTLTEVVPESAVPTPSRPPVPAPGRGPITPPLAPPASPVVAQRPLTERPATVRATMPDAPVAAQVAPTPAPAATAIPRPPSVAPQPPPALVKAVPVLASPAALVPAVVPDKPAKPTLPDGFEEMMVHRVMQRVDVLLEKRLRDAIAHVVQEQTRSVLPRLREEVESVVRQSVYEAVADELASHPGSA